MSRGGRRRGAGRPGHRLIAGATLRLDVRQMVRQGLHVGDIGCWRWHRSGEVFATIGYQVLADRVQLSYQHNGAPVHQWIARRWTPCHFGGLRQWFGCPNCERSVAVLYFRRGRFGCRTCQGIAYQSQSEAFLTRIHRKRERLEARLGGRCSRPKGMHQTTYKRLRSQIRECESVLDNLLWRFLDSRGWT